MGKQPNDRNKLRFLSNIYDPDLPDAMGRLVRRNDQTQTQAWEELQFWLKGKVIGDPQPTEKYTAEFLKAHGFVGVYEITDSP